MNKFGKCTLCGKETENKVNDNIGGKSFLCNECEYLFSQCKVCNEYFLNEEMEGGFCENCK